MGNEKKRINFSNELNHTKGASTHNVCECAIWTPFPLFWRCPSPYRGTLATPRQARCLPPSASGRARKQNATLHFKQPQQQKPAATNCGMQLCMCVRVSVCVWVCATCGKHVSIFHWTQCARGSPNETPVQLDSHPNPSSNRSPSHDPFPLSMATPHPLSERESTNGARSRAHSGRRREAKTSCCRAH